MSIKFGLTEKERILQLAREEDDDPCIPSTSQPTTTETAVLQAAIKRGKEYFDAVDVTLRPIAPFIRVRPKLPRAIRQKVLDRLTGQHLALEAVLSSNKSTKSDTSEVLSPPLVAADNSLVQRSIAAAVEQEADMYDRCSSAQVYQNLAARCSALDWRKEVRAAAAAEQAYEKLLNVQRGEEKRKEEEQDGLAAGFREKKKRKKLEVEDSIAVDNTTDNKNINKAATTTTATTTTVNPPFPKNKQVKGLVESDLDWEHAKPDTSDDIQRQKLRQSVLKALESCPKWNLLVVAERVATVERCILKIVSNSGEKSIEDTALQRLAMQYIDYMLSKRKI